ncbi:MAG: TetR/AcrR family transcriptional regulator [Myxococcota bacterium]
MPLSTRQQLLDAARHLFASRGFYGASLKGIADELGLTKQALLHHFGSKERLYAEILSQVSDSMVGRVRLARQAASDPIEQLVAFFDDYLGAMNEESDTAQILMRELVDNHARADKVNTWYLRPFLDELVAIARALPSRSPLDEAEAFAFVYSLLGAVHYFSVSRPTLQKMYGRRRFASHRREMSAEIRRLIEARAASLGG